MQEVIYVDAIEPYTNTVTGKGWSPREEAIIADLMAKESVTRMEAIRRMRRRKLDDLKGKIRIVRAATTSPESVDGRCPCGAALTGKRRGAKWCSDACRMRLGRQNKPKTCIQNKGVADAKIASLVVGGIKQDVRVSPALETRNAGETLDQYFSRPDTPMLGSPVGTTMVRILAKYPNMTFDAAREEAKRLLDKAAGRDHYHLPQVLGEEQKQAASERLAAIRKAA